MQRVINRALSGDEKALALLDIGDIEVVPKTKPMTRETLRSEFKYASTQYLAAMHLNLKSLERLAKRYICLLYTSPSPRDQRGSRMPSSA